MQKVNQFSGFYEMSSIGSNINYGEANLKFTDEHWPSTIHCDRSYLIDFERWQEIAYEDRKVYIFIDSLSDASNNCSRFDMISSKSAFDAQYHMTLIRTIKRTNQ